MDAAMTTLIFLSGMTMLGIGLYVRAKNIALCGIANILAASLLLVRGAFELPHYLLLVLLALVVFAIFRPFTSEMWRDIRLEIACGLGVIALIWTTWVSQAHAPRSVQIGLSGILAALTVAWIGMILLRIATEHSEQSAR